MVAVLVKELKAIPQIRSTHVAVVPAVDVVCCNFMKQFRPYVTNK
jgi:hypothetical protein